jgi:hypothetical protein
MKSRICTEQHASFLKVIPVEENSSEAQEELNNLENVGNIRLFSI